MHDHPQQPYTHWKTAVEERLRARGLKLTASDAALRERYEDGFSAGQMADEEEARHRVWRAS